MPAARPTPAAIAGLALAFAACAPPSPPQASTTDSPSARSYTVRGMVVRLPQPGTAEPEILIRHAAIPDFVNSEGHETGMPGMTMPFPIAAGISLAGLAPGQLVEFTLCVDWQASPPMELTAIRPLPAGAPNAPAAPGR